MENDKRLLWPWIATGILLPVLYVLSFGPAIRLYYEGRPAGRAIWVAYQPMTRLTFHGPQPVQLGLQRYLRFCTDSATMMIVSHQERGDLIPVE